MLSLEDFLLGIPFSCIYTFQENKLINVNIYGELCQFWEIFYIYILRIILIFPMVL